jgi:hypothetical protein
MDFDNDLFISYAHIDNLPLSTEQEGWISLLHKGLEVRLSQLRGERPRIWRDPKLQGNDYFGDTILDQFPKVALLVSILSPRYLKSEWCLRELAHFFKAAAANGGVRLSDNKARIFKVIKTFVPYDRHPPELEPLLGYEFYEFDDAQRPREFSQLFGPESERKFWAKLEDLAYDIHQALEALTLPSALPEQPAAAPHAPAESAKTVYLAEVTSDLEDERDKIRRELQQRGYRIVPDQPLPNPPDFEPLVRTYLEQSALSVHLISARNSSLSTAPTLEELQQQMVIARSREQISLAAACGQERKDFSRLLWLPPTANLSQANDFVQALQNEPDFLSTSLETLKTLIHDRLTQPAQAAEPLLEPTGAVQIYLDCDERDLERPEIEPLYEWLEQHFQVVLPDFEDNGVTRSEGLLKQCEAVLIYYGEASGLWLKRRLLALKKTLYGRPKPLLAKAIYLANPAKQSFADPEVPVIQGFGPFQPTLLESFLAQLGEG